MRAIKCDQCGKIERNDADSDLENWFNISAVGYGGAMRGAEPPENELQFCSVECICDYLEEYYILDNIPQDITPAKEGPNWAYHCWKCSAPINYSAPYGMCESCLGNKTKETGGSLTSKQNCACSKCIRSVPRGAPYGLCEQCLLLDCNTTPNNSASRSHEEKPGVRTCSCQGCDFLPVNSSTNGTCTACCRNRCAGNGAPCALLNPSGPNLITR